MESLEDLENFVYEVASNAPIPGGGAVAGVAGSLGVALASMVANFTLGKKKSEAYEQDCLEKIQTFNQQIRQLLDLAKKDTVAYGFVQKAFSLPKSNEEEKKARSEAIEKACEKSLMVPLEILKLLKTCTKDLENLSSYSNTNLDSDTAGAATLINSASITSWYCAWSNLPFIKNEDKKNALKTQLNQLKNEVHALTETILDQVKVRMKIED